MKQTVIDRINNIQGLAFAFDGCHKIYVIEDETDYKIAFDNGYLKEDIFPMNKLLETFENSCPLRFISNMKLTKRFINQCEMIFDDDYSDAYHYDDSNI